MLEQDTQFKDILANATDEDIQVRVTQWQWHIASQSHGERLVAIMVPDN